MGTHKVVLDEHARLEVLLRDLRAVSGWDAELFRDRQVRMRLAQDLQSLKVRLRRHFDTEESGSYMEEIRSRKHSAGDALRALQVEHPVFLEQIASLESACQGEDEAVESYKALLNKLARVLDLLKRHEERENALIKEVFQS